MNICIVGQYPPQLGGVATYTKQLEDTLRQEGHSVYILTYKQDLENQDNVYMANTLNFPFLRGLSFIISSYFLLRKIIKKHDIDIVHANYIIPPGFISILNKKLARIVITCHGSDINILSSNKFLRPLIKYTLKKADEVYFVSKKLQEKAKNMGLENIGKKSQITPNTVDTNKFNNKKTEKKILKEYDKPIVTFIGNLVKQKGLKYLLDAKKLSKTEYILLIYGDGPEKEFLKEYIKTNNIKDTYLMGKTNIPEKIIPETDIMVLPSLSEGASIIALESMSCAKAFISTNTGNIESIITNKENGIIVPPKNSQKLSEAIDELIEDENKRKIMGKKAREFIIKKYSKMEIPYLKENIKKEVQR